MTQRRLWTSSWQGGCSLTQEQSIECRRSPVKATVNLELNGTYTLNEIKYLFGTINVVYIVFSQILFAMLLQVIDNAINTENSIEEYETLTSDLLEWIEQTIVILSDRQFANSLTGVQQQLAAFNTYRIVEKPPKWDFCDACMFGIQLLYVYICF